MEELEALTKKSPSRKLTSWTKEEEDILVSYGNRITIKALAEYLGRTYSAVESKLKRFRTDGRMMEEEEE